jgi:hypothetical protein
VDRDIQPRTVPEILDAGFRLYRRHFGLLLGLSFATTLPLPEAGFHSEVQANQVRPNGFSATGAPGDLAALILPILVTMVLSTLKGWLVTAALTEPLLGRRASLKATLDRFVPALPALVVRLAVFAVLGVLATALLLVPGVLLYLAWIFYSEVVIVEGRGVSAFRRSAEITRGQRGRLGILITLMGLLVGSLSLAFSVTGQVLHWELAERVFTYLSLLLLGPLQSAILLVAYFDLRARKDGLDLSLRSEALGAPPTTTGVGAA